MDIIKLGKITAPQGIKGEVRVYPYTDKPTRFSEIEAVLLNGRRCRIEKARYMKNMAILKLEGIDDRNAAEAMRNRELLLPREELWKQPEDTYFVDDLVGCAVVSEDGAPVGTLKTIHSRPAQDLYEIEREDGSAFLLPAVKEFIKDVKTDEKIIVIHLIEGLI
ncbi:MAG: 16S rRNA processing protein RimM [Firmicutes bacterium]|nr:16S rRNA processing protein RimM [Bacillota bacterium]